jgi:glycosyltransferase involved in cell wall biosynthesis
MRILVVNQHVQDVIGGSEIHSDIAARELHKRGHDVLYAVRYPRSAAYDVPYHCVGVGKPFVTQFAQIVRDFRPNIILWEANKRNLLVATLIAKRHHCKFVFHISHFSDTERWIAAGTRIFNNIDREMPPLKRWLQRIKYLQWPLRSAWNYNGYYLIDGAISTQNELSNKLPVKRERKIYYAVPVHDEPMFWPRPFVLWAARIQRKKNPEKYIALARHFADRGIDFLLAGEIQDERYAFLHDPGQLPDNLHYIGLKSPEQINGLLTNALFLVHTCNPEGFGLIYIQAWLHGKPTISLYHDPEGLIEAQQFGFLSRSEEQLQTDVDRLLTDESLRRVMGDRAAQFAQANFTAEANGAEIEQFLQEIVAQ